MTNERLACSLGILIHNEAENIGKLLDALLRQKLTNVNISEIIVVSSASTDNSDDIVRQYESRDSRIRLVTESERRGKSAAINTFLEVANEELIVISSGDVIPADDAVEKIITPFTDEKIGMTGGRPFPVNKSDTFVGYWVNLQWKLHHRVALKSPKLGEMVAFRRVMERIPEDSAVDEASIEAQITAKNLQLRYIPEAIIYNKGPEKIKDFIKQRRRIASGHNWLKQRNSYQVSTSKFPLLFTVVWEEIKEKPAKVPHIILICLLEVWSRFLGWYDLKIRKKNPFKWEIIESTKQLKQEDN